MSIIRTMKTLRVCLLALLVLLLGACAGSQATPEVELSQPGDSFRIFRDGSFKVYLPSWEETQELDPESILLVHKGGQSVVVNRYQMPPAVFTKQFKSWIDDTDSVFLVDQDQLEGKPFFEFTSRESDQTVRYQAILDYCQGQTYAVVAGGRDTLENASLFQEVLASSTCEDPHAVPDLDTGKIGMMVNPANDEPREGFYPALRLAKENGVQVLHTYLEWSEVEPREGERFWDWQDFLMGYRLEEGFEISLVVNVIHTAVRGPVPEDLQGMRFDDPIFIQRFTDFILEVLERYPVTYLSIGNEVNDYFVTHRAEIPAYRTFFIAVRDRIHEEHPEIKVAMTFAYHDAESTNAVDIIEELDLGDFLPLTLYIYSPGFEFDREPAEFGPYLERVLELADGKPIALVETGWSTAETLGGSQEDQAAYLRNVFQWLAEHRDQVEFISWFDLHDSLLENSATAALSFLPEDAPQTADEEFMGTFVDFLNYFGLRESDGSPKLAWYAFQEEASAYLAGFGEAE